MVIRKKGVHAICVDYCLHFKGVLVTNLYPIFTKHILTTNNCMFPTFE